MSAGSLVDADSGQSTMTRHILPCDNKATAESSAQMSARSTRHDISDLSASGHDRCTTWRKNTSARHNSHMIAVPRSFDIDGFEGRIADQSISSNEVRGLQAPFPKPPDRQCAVMPGSGASTTFKSVYDEPQTHEKETSDEPIAALRIYRPRNGKRRSLRESLDDLFRSSSNEDELAEAAGNLAEDIAHDRAEQVAMRRESRSRRKTLERSVSSGSSTGIVWPTNAPEQDEQ